MHIYSTMPNLPHEYTLIPAEQMYIHVYTKLCLHYYFTMIITLATQHGLT